MTRIPTLRFAAALFLFGSGAFLAAPASAQTAPAIVGPTEATYAAVMRTINPKLPADKARAYARSVMASAWRTHLDARFIMSIVTVESAWRANAVSHSGARGLGQLMPGTAATLGVNAWNPSENLRGTSNYLKSLMDHFAGKPNAVKLAIAGYNAGPKAVERFHGIPPYGETQHYVVKVLRVWGQLNARIGRSLAPAPVTVTAAARLPDVQHWLSDANEILPATAAAFEGASSPAATVSGTPAESAAPQPSDSPK
jgi:soluble lytic murein transglycosylase-like protein